MDGFEALRRLCLPEGFEAILDRLIGLLDRLHFDAQSQRLVLQLGARIYLPSQITSGVLEHGAHGL